MGAAIFQLDDLHLSGLDVRPAGLPKGLLVALPGGGYLAGYWDYPGASLLRLAAERGFRAVALDRPGYGAAFGQPCGLARQAEIVLDLIAELRRDEGAGPVIVAGHSMGGILALMIAAHPRAGLVTAIDVCGAPLGYPQHMAEALANRRPDAGQTHYPLAAPEHSRALFYGPEGSFDLEALVYDAKVSAPVPVAELPDAVAAPETLAVTMPRIALPVRFSFAEFEACSIVDQTMVAHAKALLANSPRAEVRTQPGAGHNISLHRVGGEFHRDMLDWFESVAA